MKIKQTIYKRPYTECDLCERKATNRVTGKLRYFDWYLCGKHLEQFKEAVAKLEVTK